MNTEPLYYITEPVEAANRLPLKPQEQAVLEQINQKIAAAASVEDLVDTLFDATRNICPCDRIALAFLEDEGRRIVAHYARASYEPLLLHKGYSEDLSRSTLQQVIDHGQIRIINDLEAYHKTKPESHSTTLLVREGVRSSMTCPLTVEGRNVGVLFRSSRQTYAYGPEQSAMHRTIAERLSQAVEKAYRIEQLTEANRAYFEMLGFVAHELKSPMASIVMDADVMARGYLGELDQKQKKKLDAIINKGHFLLNLVRDYLNLSRLEGGDMDAEPREFNFVGDVLEPALDLVHPQLEESKMQLTRQIPDELRLEADPDLLMIVMTNLLSNAVKYGREGGEIRVRADQADDEVKIRVWNEGPGFPPEQRSRLFRKFSRLRTPELLKRKGTGVGLYTSWRIVRLHGGRMDADAKEGEWAEFSFTVPQPLPQQA